MKTITINPEINFGKPTVNGTRRATWPLFDRFRAGDSVAFIARDCDLKRSQVEAAIRYECATKAGKKRMCESP